MNLSANAQATLLLTAIFLARRRVSINLLVIVNGGVCIMAEAPTYQSRRASGAATQEKLTGWSDPRISQERILGCWRVVIVWRWL